MRMLMELIALNSTMRMMMLEMVTAAIQCQPEGPGARCEIYELTRQETRPREVVTCCNVF